ncbi:MAG: DinB family protein [Bacteroidota bacterium]
MSNSGVRQSILNAVSQYQLKLATQNEAKFQETPAIGGWSYSEVYSHIFDSSLLSLRALQACIKGNGLVKPTPFGARLVLFFGKLPPGKKYKVPRRLAERVKKIDLITAQQLINDFELQLAKVYPLMGKADLKIKIEHPRLGYLNATQWLRFIVIHLKHHLKQLTRIEKSFKSQ